MVSELTTAQLRQWHNLVRGGAEALAALDAIYTGQSPEMKSS
jgi:hypothetical protein